MYARADFDLVEVPSIEAPFAVEKADYAEEAQQRHVQWADRYDIFGSEGERRKFAAMDLGALAALLYPEASSARDTQLLADWCAWLLLRDDRWDALQEPGHWERLASLDRSYLSLLRSAGSGSSRSIVSAPREDGLYRALEDLLFRLNGRARVRGTAQPVDGRFVSVMKRFFLASVRELDHQQRSAYPDLADYVETRSATGGLDILTFVQAALDGRRLPASYLPTAYSPTAYLPGGASSDRLFDSLTRVSENICCWHNDLVSLQKEILSGEVHNLILALLHDEAADCWSLEEAVGLAVRMIHEELETFARLEHEAAEATGSRSDSMRWYARTLRHRIGGIIVWQEACAARYQQAFAPSK